MAPGPRAGLAVLVVAAGVTVVAVLGPQAAILLLPAPAARLGCWALAAVLLVSTLRGLARAR